VSNNSSRKEAEAVNAAIENGAAESRQPPATIAPGDSSAERHARLVKLLRKGLQRFVNDVARVLTSEDQGAIHDLRVWSRRLQQVLVGMYGETLPRRARALRRVLRRTRGTIGQWRNYDVVIETVQRRVKRARNAERQRAWSMVLKSASEARRREIRRERKRLMKLDVFGLREAGEALIEAGGPAHATLDACFWTAVSQAYDRWSEAHANALKSKQTEDIHAFRIRTKRLRYRIELARELGIEGTKPLLEWLKKLQDGLGRWGDRVELGRIIARSIADPERLLKESRASIVLLTELERLRRRADRELGELLRSIDRSAGFSLCQEWMTVHAKPAVESQATVDPPAIDSHSHILP
jgi:CHAD domain-containing protein